jgi:hypothetical protein
MFAESLPMSAVGQNSIKILWMNRQLQEIIQKENELP